MVFSPMKISSSKALNPREATPSTISSQGRGDELEAWMLWA